MTYLGITLGPIYKTLMTARKTRELWSASYTFSMLMRTIMDKLKEYGTFLSPYDEALRPIHGAGVWPDRCYVALSKQEEELDLETIRESILLEFAQRSGISAKDLGYYQLYMVAADIAQNPIQTLNLHLDTLELQQTYAHTPPLDWAMYWTQGDFFQKLYQNAYEEEDILRLIAIDDRDVIRRFPSLPEIATNDLNASDPVKYYKALGYQILDTQREQIFHSQLKPEANALEEDNTEEIISALKKAYKEKFLFRHKYVSIINADGDNVGALIQAIEGQRGDIQAFSKALNGFAVEATKMLVHFGAFPVYAGGDDLLFFAPVANEYLDEGISLNGLLQPNETHGGNIMGKNLFFLLTKLNTLFKQKLMPIVDACNQKIEKEEDKLKPVSLSFGVFVGYHKYPMNEMLERSHELLAYGAKKQKGKNVIDMEIQKHSGQSFRFKMRQEGKLYWNFLQLSSNDAFDNEQLLHSVMYKLQSQHAVVGAICQDVVRLNNFFDENFNESVHAQYRGFFSQLAHLIVAYFTERYEQGMDKKKAMQEIYAALRFIHFLRAKDSADDGRSKEEESL